MDWLPPAASTYAADIDRIFWIIMIVTGVIFILVEATLVVFLFKYRGREGRKAHYIEGNTRAEVIWTVTPAVLILLLAFASQTVWSKIKNPDRFPPDAIQMAVEAKQFEWNFRYPGPDGLLGNDDDFVIRNQLHVPVDRPVTITMTSIDAIHSLFVPVFRIKQDAVPGMEIPIWFEATETGEFELACAELCGNGHTRMRARVFVHSQSDYEAWLAEQAS